MEENQNISNILQNKNLMAVIIIAVVVAVGLVLYIYSLNKNGAFDVSQPTETPQKTKFLSEAEIQKQLEEIDRLRQESGAKTLSATETKKQLNKIEAERKKDNAQPLTEEEIQKQLDEINKLRSQ